MRDILFRGKSKNTNKWVYGFLYISKNGKYEIGMYDKGFDIERYTYLVIPETVGQFTGLYDKHGTRIFEGDIVKGKLGFCGSPNLPLKEYIFQVKYSNGCFEEIYSSDYYEFEVIGNVYDNPELLKKERATD